MSAALSLPQLFRRLSWASRDTDARTTGIKCGQPAAVGEFGGVAVPETYSKRQHLPNVWYIQTAVFE